MSTDLLFFDCETTGVNPAEDRIVEICFHRQGGPVITHRVNPTVPIPAEAAAIHGITDDDVRDLPRFRQYAAAIQALIEGTVLVGFNCRRFDSLILDYELRRCGQKGLARDPKGRIVHPELDLYQIWMKSESRSLSQAAIRFAGTDLGETAHSADADTRALPHILDGMVTAFGLQDLDVDALCAMCVPEGALDRDGKFLRREDGVVIYNFGPKKNEPVSADTGLLRWMLKKDFPEDTKAIALELLTELTTPAAAVRTADLFG